MPKDDRHSASETVLLSFAEAQHWNRLVPGTAPKLATELVRSTKQQRALTWARFVVESTVRLSACAVALLMAINHAATFAAVPIVLAVVGDPMKVLGRLVGVGRKSTRT